MEGMVQVEPTASAFSITVSKHVFKQNCLQYFIAIHAIEVV